MAYKSYWLLSLGLATYSLYGMEGQWGDYLTVATPCSTSNTLLSRPYLEYKDRLKKTYNILILEGEKEGWGEWVPSRLIASYIFATIEASEQWRAFAILERDSQYHELLSRCCSLKMFDNTTLTRAQWFRLLAKVHPHDFKIGNFEAIRRFLLYNSDDRKIQRCLQTIKTPVFAFEYACSDLVIGIISSELRIKQECPLLLSINLKSNDSLGCSKDAVEFDQLSEDLQKLALDMLDTPENKEKCRLYTYNTPEMSENKELYSISIGSIRWQDLDVFFSELKKQYC